MGIYDVPVRDYMHASPRTVRHSDRVHTAAALLRDARVSGLAVVDDAGRAVGVISNTDLMRLEPVSAATGTPGRHPMLPDHTVGEVMSHPPIAVGTDASLANAVQRMGEASVHRVLVLDAEQRPVGIVSTWDALRRVVDARVMLPVRDLMAGAMVTAEPDDPVHSAIERMRNSGVRGLVVIEREWPVGVFTQKEAIAAELSPEPGSLERWISSALLCVPPDMPCFRAAAQALENATRYLVVVSARRIEGLLTPSDLLVL